MSWYVYVLVDKYFVKILIYGKLVCIIFDLGKEDVVSWFDFIFFNFFLDLLECKFGVGYCIWYIVKYLVKNVDWKNL